jgi:hypothetical protein
MPPLSVVAFALVKPTLSERRRPKDRVEGEKAALLQYVVDEENSVGRCSISLGPFFLDHPLLLLPLLARLLC